MINEISFPGLGLHLSISRVAFQIGDFSIYWYGLLIALGLGLALLYGLRESKRVGLSQDHFLNMVLWAVPVSIICARLYYVAFQWDFYRDDLLSIFSIRNGGIAIYGAIIGAFLTTFLYCRRNKLSLGLVLDILSVGLLIGQTIGRWGNFCNGEAFGITTSLPWGMTIQQDGREIAYLAHPTFLYESLWNGIGILLLLYYKRKTMVQGELFCGYMVWYGLGRLWIEGLRTDSLYFGPFRISQLLALITLSIGLILIFYHRQKSRKITSA